jgi:hypothetical protein
MKILPFFFYFVTFFYIAVPFSVLSNDEPLLVRELKNVVKNLSGFEIDVRIAHNKETKRKDLYVTPSGEGNYSIGTFLYSVAKGVDAITSRSITYRLYTGMVMIDIKEELWAISAENCRKTFKQKTVEEQNVMLQNSLKRLR